MTHLKKCEVQMIEYLEFHNQLYCSKKKFFVLKSKNEVIPINKIKKQLLEGDHLWLINGNKCTTKKGIFNEFQTTMSFPDYFGKNWDALIDCMGDLAWINRLKKIKKQSHFVIISQANKLTELNFNDRKILLYVLSCIEDRWNEGLSDKKGVYKIIFSCSFNELAIVINMMTESGITYTILENIL
jgi:hypothetical protein